MSAIEILEELQSKYFVHPETFDFFKNRAENGFTKPYYDLSISEARESSLRSSRMFAGSVDYDGNIHEINIPSKTVKGNNRYKKSLKMPKG